VRPAPVDVAAGDVVARINARDADGLVALFSPAMKAALPLEKAKPFVKGVLDARGPLVAIAREAGRGGARSGTYRITAERGEWRAELVVDDAGTILGFSLGEPPPPEPPVVKSTLVLGLPFRGQWSVLWGGSTLDVNQHVTHASQRRAADLVVVDTQGKSHAGDGKKNDDYYAYGREVVAVADGIVTVAIDGVMDNEPGTTNPYFTMGNAVFVQHAPDLFSVYAHLQPGKLRVRAGARVKKGQVLGLCGNTGNSSEPHLHFQLQDGPRFEESLGVEAVFEGVAVTRGGETTTRTGYTFLRGDLVGEPASNARP
jgi:murein DD-endopeptidase MepM/ murein hydrolase activator NlpD